MEIERLHFCFKNTVAKITAHGLQKCFKDTVA